MDELNVVFNSPRPMTEATKKSHIQTLKKIQSLYDITKPLNTFTPTDIRFITNTDGLSSSYKKKIMSLFIVIKSTFTNDNAEMAELRQLLHEYTSEMTDKRVNDFKSENTDLYDTIEEWINSLDIDDDPTKFIVNWLVFYKNIRNLDLLVKVIDADTTMNDDTINYLVVYPDHIQYIRNTYKTSTRYGQKNMNITDPRFIHAVSSIKKGTYLLSDKPNSLGKMIKRKLYNEMTETDYLHQTISKFEGDTNKIFEIENNRGSNIRTLLTNYNKSFNHGK
jgi:hypothetical protein